MKENRWNIPESAPIPEALLREGYTPLLAALLAARGMASPEQARAFLDAGPAVLGDPFLLRDMDAAAARIRLARERGEKAAVYGDYDVDGITATCLLTEFLQGWGLDTVHYIPDRLSEGYGVNPAAIDRLAGQGVKLIITVDCGITAVEETAHAAALGVDIIVTDHHECQAQLPAAVAVVDPKRPDSAYPDRMLAGVGVAFKLACALDGDGPALLERFADLAAIGTVADVMPLVGENRRIVRAGLERLRTAPRPGLAALMELAGVNGSRLGANTMGFTLAPRINAAGRLGRAELAAELLLAGDSARARALAEELCEMNRQRQQLEADIWEEAADMLAGQTVTGPIVLAREGWHQGVIGIVASRLADAYQVPVVMISLEGDRGKGSCRSWGGFNLFDALAACEDALTSFGGHALAAGLNVARRDVDRLRAALDAYYRTHPPQEDAGLCPDLLVTDGRVLSMECVESLELLEPFGSGNPRPLLCITDAVLTDAAPIGGGKHIRLSLEKFGLRFDAVWFGRRIADLPAAPGDRVDAAFYPQISEFRGRGSVQLVMTDLRRTDISALCRGILEGGPLGDWRLSVQQLRGLYKALMGRCPCRVRLSRLAELEPRLHPAQTALGLRILRELSLASVRLEKQDVELMLIAWEDKTDLNGSPTWRSLSGPGRPL